MNQWVSIYGIDWGMNGRWPICSVWILLFTPLGAATLIALFAQKSKWASATL